MIQTLVKHRKEDYLYIARVNRLSKDNLVVFVLEIACGIAIINEIFPMLKGIFLYHYSYGIGETILMWLALLFAIGCICTPLFRPYIVAMKLQRKYKKDSSTQELVWGTDEVISKARREGISEEQHIAYSIMDKYFEKNEALYIRLQINGEKHYLVVRDDSYLEGSKAELMVLLEEKGIQKG